MAGKPALIAMPSSVEAEPVVLIDELAGMLKTSVRTLQRQIRAGALRIPEMERLDHRHRWSRAVVLQHIEASRQPSVRPVLVKRSGR